MKVSLFSSDLDQLFSIHISNIAQPNSRVVLNGHGGEVVDVPSYQAAVDVVLSHLPEDTLGDGLVIGHRIVHGGTQYNEPTQITDEVLDGLTNLIPLAPLHMQTAVELVRLLQDRFPEAMQVACFDTAFYSQLPSVAKQLPLPRQYIDMGMRRYGFHGLSYQYLTEAFAKEAGDVAVNGRIIMAHLGSGASVTAMKNGEVVDTSMSFSPASGIPMSTRSGDLDPGIVSFLHEKTGMSIEDFNDMVNHQSGLLGVSGVSADMERLLNQESSNPHITEAIDLFCYQIQKTIGSYYAVMGGLDSLIFSGGMGQNSSAIRARICKNLSHLGILISEERNNQHGFLISDDGSAVGVHMLPTNEMYIIAKQTKETIEQREG